MRVLLAIAEMGVGGAEAVVCDLAHAAIDRGHMVAVAAAPGPMDRKLSELPLERFPLPPGGRSPIAAAATGIAARSALRRFRPTLVHAHNPRIAGIFSVAARLAGADRPPVLATYHGGYPGEIRAAARIMRIADHVVCVSRKLADGLRAAGVPADRMAVIPNGVPAIPPSSLERRSALDSELGLDDAIVVSAVGRLAPEKGHHLFLRAAAIVGRANPRVRFLLVGDGPLRQSLERSAEELGVGQRIRFTGVRPDARELIARSDLLVFSSEWEGLPLVALEGLAAGVALISTEVAGIDELAYAGAALLVPRDAEALASGILSLIADPKRRSEMGRRGRRLHERRFSTPSMIEPYLALYGVLLHR